jgi:hypothetical protein
MDEMKQTGLRLSERTLERVRQLAQREHRSINAQITVLIERGLDEREGNVNSAGRQTQDDKRSPSGS